MIYTKENIIGRSFKHRDSNERMPIGYTVIGLTAEGVIKTVNFYTDELSSWPDMATVQKVNEWVRLGVWIPTEKINNSYEIF